MEIREMIEFLQRFATINGEDKSIDDIIQYLKSYLEAKYIVEGEQRFYEEDNN